LQCKHVSSTPTGQPSLLVLANQQAGTPQPRWPLTVTGCDICCSWLPGAAACWALLALGAGSTSLAIVANGALQHCQVHQLVQGQVCVGVEGVGAVAVDHTRTGLDKALGDEPLLAGVVIGGAACRALLAGLAAALGRVEAGRTATGTCRGREGGGAAAADEAGSSRVSCTDASASQGRFGL
jgi:hypothetical protein